MESNEQTELTRKMGIDSYMEKSMTASEVVRWDGGGNEQKRKRTHGHGQQCGDC